MTHHRPPSLRYEVLKDDAIRRAKDPNSVSALPKERGPFYFAMAKLLTLCGVRQDPMASQPMARPGVKKSTVAPTPTKTPLHEEGGNGATSTGGEGEAWGLGP